MAVRINSAEQWGELDDTELFDFEEPTAPSAPPTESDERPLLQRYPYVGLALVLALVVAAIWFLEGSRLGASDESAAVTLAGDVGGTTPRVGEQAPVFTLETLSGEKLSLADLRGRPVVINFWATWCPPCRGEMPDLNALPQEYREAGLVVLAVNLQEDRATVQRYADQLGLSLGIVLDQNGVVAGRYNLTALPTTYFVGPDGTIRDLNIGALTDRGLKSKVAKIVS